jgi:hypothetical protein
MAALIIMAMVIQKLDSSFTTTVNIRLGVNMSLAEMGELLALMAVTTVLLYFICIKLIAKEKQDAKRATAVSRERCAAESASTAPGISVQVVDETQRVVQSANS